MCPPSEDLRLPLVAGDGNVPEAAFTTLQQQQFNVALATMFYLCALPFAVVESQAFREPFMLLAPGIRFPSRHSLSGDLLRRVREQIHERAVALIRLQKFVTIVTDSWTNVGNSTIINFMVVAPGMPSAICLTLPPGQSDPRSTLSNLKELLRFVLPIYADLVRRPTSSSISTSSNSTNESFASSVLKEARLQSKKTRHVQVDTIPPMTNLTERLLSVTRTTWSAPPFFIARFA
ncbi:unnamed protein product [Phytophthora fragariaefolia]|uniref:Unnamed protein product n=1 Tax=Phytophthora fragariaefolia TaxID=1490495 RepID=A0A9W6WTD3_9STRA|nr:unnamed protein product [Phytophthora fragariaefolia]